jgi:GGDEF domain-containing protein
LVRNSDPQKFSASREFHVLHDRMTQFASTPRKAWSLGVIAMDLRSVNSRFSSSVGSDLIGEMDHYLRQQAAHHGGIVAKIAGNQFAVVMPVGALRAGEYISDWIKTHQKRLGIAPPGLRNRPGVSWQAPAIHVGIGSGRANPGQPVAFNLDSTEKEALDALANDKKIKGTLTQHMLDPGSWFHFPPAARISVPIRKTA